MIPTKKPFWSHSQKAVTTFSSTVCSAVSTLDNLDQHCLMDRQHRELSSLTARHASSVRHIGFRVKNIMGTRLITSPTNHFERRWARPCCMWEQLTPLFEFQFFVTRQSEPRYHVCLWGVGGSVLRGYSRPDWVYKHRTIDRMKVTLQF